MAELVAAWLANYAAHSTLLIGGAWLISSLAPLEPATRDLMWRLALLGGLVTATGTVSGQLLEDRHAGSRLGEAPALAVVRESLWLPGGDRAAATVRLRGEVSQVTAECRSAVRSSPFEVRDWLGSIRSACSSRGLPWYSTAALIWLLGAAVCVGLEVRRRRHLRDAFLSLGDPDAGVLASLAALSAETGVTVSQVGCSPLLSSPSVLPGNVLALPMRCADDLSKDELRAALAHELAHVERNDVRWLGLFRWVAALCWLQPLNRLAIRRLQEAAEGVCDDWALSCTGQPLALARSISTVAEWGQVGCRVSVPVAMTGENGWGLTERISRILGDRPRRVDPVWIHVVVVLTMGIPIAALPALPVPERPPEALVVRMDADAIHLGAAGARSDAVERRVVIARVRGD